MSDRVGRRHSRAERQCPAPVLQRGETCLERRPRGVPGPRVLVALVLPHRNLGKGRRLENWDGDRAGEPFRLLAGVDREGIETGLAFPCRHALSMRRSVRHVTEVTERRRRVVVVEDDDDIASLLTDILETEGYAPVVVSDAATLDSELDSRPDLIVLDLSLSRGGADHILRSLRARKMGDVPVLLLSAATDLPDRARELGVTRYLAKPFEVEELLGIVRAMV